jgi:hypothetical protein
MTDYKAVAASLRACTDPQKRHAADVIDELLTLAAGWRDQHASEIAEVRAERDEWSNMENERTAELQKACDEIVELKAEIARGAHDSANYPSESKRADISGGPGPLSASEYIRSLIELLEAALPEIEGVEAEYGERGDSRLSLQIRAALALPPHFQRTL